MQLQLLHTGEVLPSGAQEAAGLPLQAGKLGAGSIEIIFAMRVAGIEVLQGNQAALEIPEPQKVAEQGKAALLDVPHTLALVTNNASAWSVRISDTICGCRRPLGTQQAAAG